MTRHIVSGTVLDEHIVYTLEEICATCDSRTEWVVQLVELGVLQPAGTDRRSWRFPGDSLHVAMKARRLQQDLDLNLSGVALVLELLEEVEILRSKLQAFERFDD